MALERNSLRVLIPTYTISLFWSSFVAVQLVWRLLKRGPRQFFYCKKRDIRPELLDNPALGTHNFARLRELKLHYVASGPSHKPLMLFIHGFPEFWYSWRYQLKEFSKDYRCVAFDMRGYSESDKPSGVHNYAMEKLTNDVKELIPALGYEKCILVAHDWGGAVAWDLAWRNPELVERLVVCNCPNGKGFSKHLAKSRSQFFKSWYMFVFQLPYLPELMFKVDDMYQLENAFKSREVGLKRNHMTEDEMEAFKYSLTSGEGGISGPINFYRASFRYKRQPYPTDKVQVPSLIVWGTGDGALEKEMAALSAEACEDCRVQYIEGASHWVQQEEPEQTNAFIREFLEE